MELAVLANHVISHVTVGIFIVVYGCADHINTSLSPHHVSQHLSMPVSVLFVFEQFYDALYLQRLAAQSSPIISSSLLLEGSEGPTRDPHQHAWFALRTLLEQMRREYPWETIELQLWRGPALSFMLELVHES